MKKLDTKVNIIPIIAKADTISKTELQRFKVSENSDHLLNDFHRIFPLHSRPKLIKSCPPMVYKSINFPLMMKPLPKWMCQWTHTFHLLSLVRPNLCDSVTKRFELDNIHGEQFRVSGSSMTMWISVWNEFPPFQLTTKLTAISLNYVKCWFVRIWKICVRKLIPVTTSYIVRSGSNKWVSRMWIAIINPLVILAHFTFFVLILNLFLMHSGFIPTNIRGQTI